MTGTLPLPKARWQTTIADLALILFLLSAAGLAHSPPPPADEALPAATASAPALAIWREGNASAPLAQWLAEQGSPPGSRISATLSYAPGEAGAALDRAQALLRELGPSARLTLREANQASLLVAITLDQPQDQPEAATGARLASPDQEHH